jgi:hypothetical protein
VPLGETWTCESCGRRWDTSRIPAAEYDARVRRLRRYRLEVVVVLGLLMAIFIPLIVWVDQSFIFLAGIASFAWIFLYMPVWRRRVRKAVAESPSWELHAE